MCTCVCPGATCWKGSGISSRARKSDACRNLSDFLWELRHRTWIQISKSVPSLLVETIQVFIFAQSLVTLWSVQARRFLERSPPHPPPLPFSFPTPHMKRLSQKSRSRCSCSALSFSLNLWLTEGKRRPKDTWKLSVLKEVAPD